MAFQQDSKTTLAMMAMDRHGKSTITELDDSAGTLKAPKMAKPEVEKFKEDWKAMMSNDTSMHRQQGKSMAAELAIREATNAGKKVMVVGAGSNEEEGRGIKIYPINPSDGSVYPSEPIPIESTASLDQRSSRQIHQEMLKRHKARRNRKKKK